MSILLELVLANKHSRRLNVDAMFPENSVHDAHQLLNVHLLPETVPCAAHQASE
ncbi:Zn-dependent hydrolase, including glyoxylase [Zea mays]|jgi:hypothetical protein|uniref:Zn-dependent hydrolase, including glyoxylase n=1 Tax=Zea mays TaxID=4577 RepID=A0A1D6QA39_MAIZE|nr:Zn-dependent hydrolase, including glyoxylase [Zea mays]